METRYIDGELDQEWLPIEDEELEMEEYEDEHKQR